MKVDLGPLPWFRARELLDWCVEHKIDQEGCLRVIENLTAVPVPDNPDWTLEIPDKHMTFFALKWISNE